MFREALVSYRAARGDRIVYRSAAGTHAKPLNLLDGISDLHFENMLADLGGRPVGDGIAEDAFAWALQKPLTAESLYRSMLVAVDGSLEAADETALNSVREIFPEVFPEESVSVLKQSLFLSNNPTLQQIVSARPGSVLTQLLSRDDNQVMVRTAFQATFGRQPDDDELIACTEFLSERAENRHAGVSQLIWALLTSAEFRFNH